MGSCWSWKGDAESLRQPLTLWQVRDPPPPPSPTPPSLPLLALRQSGSGKTTVTPPYLCRLAAPLECQPLKTTSNHVFPFLSRKKRVKCGHQCSSFMAVAPAAPLSDGIWGEAPASCLHLSRWQGDERGGRGGDSMARAQYWDLINRAQPNPHMHDLPTSRLVLFKRWSYISVNGNRRHFI